MSNVGARLADFKRQMPVGYWGERIFAQVEYAANISKTRDHEFDDLLHDVMDFLVQKKKEEDAITRETALKAEEMLSQLSSVAKSYRMICAGHAHIDMNWMWGWDETVAVTLDTFRTVLDLMNEYPQFKFSQSQASVYRILEEYAPEMLEEVQARVKEGRWEVTACTWVEADKNMPNGESQARHILYTKRYLSKLLGIDPESLNIDFEPDTFGHHQNVPEILSQGGVKYYYHCRGSEGYHLYRWMAPSGSSVLVYREPIWYNAEINPSMAFYVPEFCKEYGMNAMLKVYGVGDHGGGPTRRDLERIIDMNSWPVFPVIEFGTFGEFFSLAEKVKDRLPVVTGEQNFVFTGCYTTQTRIKKANRIAEAVLNEAEAACSAAAVYSGFPYSSEGFAKAWEDVLFNQFHDIIPGSCVIGSREYAMGLFQKAMARANTQRSLALRSIAANIDTSGLLRGREELHTVSEGAGAGFGIQDFKILQGERGRGKTRIFHVFNPSAHEREDLAELVIWDWDYDLGRLICKDEQGFMLAHQVLDHGFNNYWGHKFVRILVKVKVPAYGYRTLVVTERDHAELAYPFSRDPRVEKVEEYVLENGFVKVVFDPRNGAIRSMIDKESGEEMIDAGKAAGIFRLVNEDTSRGMTAWIVGRYKDIRNLHENVKIKKVSYGGSSLRQSITYEMEFGGSRLKAVVSLNENSPGLEYDVECDWHEVGKPHKGVPQLNFYVPLQYPCRAFKYDIPFGIIERKGMDMDVPANGFAYAVREEREKNSLMLITDSKYGFRCVDNSMAVTLIRSSYDPDPYPEQGIHRFKITLCLAKGGSNKKLMDLAYDTNHPFSVLSNTAHGGSLGLTASFLGLGGGSALISPVKMPEGQNRSKKLVIRLYETEGKESTVSLRLSRRVQQAYFMDINENKGTDSGISVRDHLVSFPIRPYSLVNICLELE